PEFANIRFPWSAEISVTGSRLLYELDPSVAEGGASVPALEPSLPGIRRMLLENHVRYAFTRFGVPYVVSVDCFNTAYGLRRFITCPDADRLIERFIGSLRVVGGTPPEASAAIAAPAPDRPADASPTFTFHAPGRLIAGTGYRGASSGRVDYTSYST